MKKILVIVIIGLFLVASVSVAGDYRDRRRRRLPEYETTTHDRYIKYERSGGFVGDGTIHFMNKSTTRRKYKKRMKQRCYTEKGRRVACP